MRPAKAGPPPTLSISFPPSPPPHAPTRPGIRLPTIHSRPRSRPSSRPWGDPPDQPPDQAPDQPPDQAGKHPKSSTPIYE